MVCPQLWLQLPTTYPGPDCICACTHSSGRGLIALSRIVISGVLWRFTAYIVVVFFWFFVRHFVCLVLDGPASRPPGLWPNETPNTHIHTCTHAYPMLFLLQSPDAVISCLCS